MTIEVISFKDTCTYNLYIKHSDLENEICLNFVHCLIQLKYPKLSVALVVMLVIKNLVIKLVFITFLMITIVFLPFKLCIHVIELNRHCIMKL